MGNRINEEQLIESLKSVPEFAKLLEVHFTDNYDEFLSTLFFADLARNFKEREFKGI